LKFLTKYADNTLPNSIVNKFRRKRFKLFLNLIKDLPKPLKILDAGGTENFWVQMGFTRPEAEITILNTEIIKTSYPNFKFILGNAKDLSMFKDDEFEIVFSNSVIEHVGDYTDQKKMADEISRVGKTYFVQTPNYYFPMEPHFLFPFFQFLPKKIQIFLVMNFNLGWFEKNRTKEEAVKTIDSVRLLKYKEFGELFTDAKIEKEKLAGFVKSFIAIKK
jgi:ubiquinone/menaquinone biosynthesis C-methylase UbiE